MKQTSELPEKNREDVKLSLMPPLKAEPDTP